MLVSWSLVKGLLIQSLIPKRRLWASERSVYIPPVISSRGVPWVMTYPGPDARCSRNAPTLLLTLHSFPRVFILLKSSLIFLNSIFRHKWILLCERYTVFLMTKALQGLRAILNIYDHLGAMNVGAEIRRKWGWPSSEPGYPLGGMFDFIFLCICACAHVRTWKTNPRHKDCAIHHQRCGKQKQSL